MKTITNSIQSISEQANATAKLWFDTSRENIEQTLGWAEKALEVRSPEDVRKFAENSMTVGRKNIERVVQAGQASLSQASELTKTELENARKRTAELGNGMSIPSMESLFDPKTYGFDIKATKRR